YDEFAESYYYVDNDPEEVSAYKEIEDMLKNIRKKIRKDIK
ncbi:4782_t:CDS:1, partial [Racocetra fulgida]